MSYEIDNPDEWRISKSGFSIKTGWGDDKRFIAKYAGKVMPVDSDEFQVWIDNAEEICEQHNATCKVNTNDDN